MNRTIVALAAVCLSYPVVAIAGGQPPASPAPSAVGMGGAGGAGGSASALAGANARAHSRSASSASVTNNITNPAGGNGAGNGGGGGYPNDITVRQAPALATGNVYSANNCAIGGGAGGSWISSALSLNFLWDGSECRNQEWYRLYILTGNTEAAKGSACLVPTQREMFKQIGQPCATDRPTPVASTAAPPPAILPISPGTAREPLPTRAQCDNPRNRETQIGRDYMAANCPIPPRW